MITFLDVVGPAIWRATWQAAILALFVALLLRCCGDRLPARWRYLLWGVVLLRLIFVATPASPWSLFNLSPAILLNDRTPIAPQEVVFEPTPVSHTVEAMVVEPAENAGFPSDVVPASRPTPARPRVIASTSPDRSPSAATSPWLLVDRIDFASIARALSAVWLAGCVLFALRLAGTAMVLRRQLATCRPVTDADLLTLLKDCQRRIGLRRTPQLLVTPASISPCIVGTWRPSIVLPESIVTEPSERHRHVLSHELAHLSRGDLWTNWLLLAVRILHWFNPVAWWTIREMQAEREAACDELAFAALGETDRSAYAATIVELASSLNPTPLAPGLIGLFSTRSRLKSRVERMLRSPSVKTLRTPVAAGLLLGLALAGLTDATPTAKANQVREATVPTEMEEPKKGTHTISSRCIDHANRAPQAGVTVLLYRVNGLASTPVEIARTVSDTEGRFTFRGLDPPRPHHHLDLLKYELVGISQDGLIGKTVLAGNSSLPEIWITREKATLRGRVVDADGQPISGANVLRLHAHLQPITDRGTVKTDADGRFQFEDVGVCRWQNGRVMPTWLTIQHPDYPSEDISVKSLPANVDVTLPDGCVVTGTVTDRVTGKPAAETLITARRTDKWNESYFSTNADGRFRLVVPEGRYDFLIEVEDRVCVAVTGRECLAGKEVELPPLKLIAGGLIAGRVVNTATGQPVSKSDSGEPIMLGLSGPSRPAGPVISPTPLAIVDEQGRFTLRAAPGENFPYFVNTRGERMAWDTRKQPAVVVKDGETTRYDMRITPPVPSGDKLKAAREIVAGLPQESAQRTDRILEEFRKLNHTVDETELWCLLMRELVAIGPEAVPRLCAELDRTTENRMLRRLGFALRAIGDPRAVPALIRAIPKTLLPGSSDFGLIVEDEELTAFMQTHDLGKGMGGTHFSLGRPVREIFGTLHSLTGQDFADAELFSMHLSEDPRRQILQRRLYQRQAQRWQQWWQANWRNFTEDAAYSTVNLTVKDEPLPPASQELGKTARLTGVISGVVLSPAVETGQYVSHALDLDTGYRPKWPSTIPNDEAARNGKPFEEWASQTGVDLICITHRAPDGTETYVLRALEMDVREISPRDLRNLDRLIAAGTLPEGRPVDELLMHYDAEAQQSVPDANATFLYVTREGNRGVIEVTDRVTRKENLTGPAGDPPAGVGFHKGVRFNLKAIIP